MNVIVILNLQINVINEEMLAEVWDYIYLASPPLISSI